MLIDREKRLEYHDSIKNSWRRIVRKQSQYKDTDAQYVDMPPDDEYSYNDVPEIDFHQLFVYVDFIKPGRQQYFVTYQNTFQEPPPTPPADVLLQ